MIGRTRLLNFQAEILPRSGQDLQRLGEKPGDELCVPVLSASLSRAISQKKSTFSRMANTTTDCWPVAPRDGHNLPGLVDECVASVAAVVDDIVEGFENPV